MKKVKKPWGNFKQFAINKKSTVKLLTINPREELSLQFHKKRDENWYFLDKAIVQLGNKKIRVKEGDFLKVKRKTQHRIIAEKNKARVIEISFGKFEEKDEKRIEDKYKRKKEVK